jgi:hypothetical protein
MDLRGYACFPERSSQACTGRLPGAFDVDAVVDSLGQSVAMRPLLETRLYIPGRHAGRSAL